MSHPIPQDEFPQYCGRTDSMGIECEKPELEQRIARLEAELRELKEAWRTTVGDGTDKLTHANLKSLLEEYCSELREAKQENERLKAHGDRMDNLLAGATRAETANKIYTAAEGRMNTREAWILADEIIAARAKEPQS
ncbi:MAG TPA: hypothetical protein VMV57_02220 [Terracidiphilus sp.]|nr:hypothetical protein [Terracidiphilus sp.]